MQILSVSQLYEVQEMGKYLNKTTLPFSANYVFQMTPQLHIKLFNFHGLLQRKPQLGVYPSPITTAQAHVRQDLKLSTKFRHRQQEILDESLGTAPAY